MEIESTDNWHILNGNQKYGLYTYKNMISMIQKNEVMDFNYVWAPHMTQWTQIHGLKEFSKDRLTLLKKSPDFADAFLDRKNPRINTLLKVLGHNNKTFFDGQITSISAEGALCLLNTPMVQVGDQIKLQIAPKDQDSVAFNVEAKVIRKNFSNERLNSKSGLYYILNFVDMQPAGMDQIKTWLK